MKPDGAVHLYVSTSTERSSPYARLGVSAVPAYVFDDKYVVEGAQSTELFLQTLKTVAEEAAAIDAGR